MTAKMLI